MGQVLTALLLGLAAAGGTAVAQDGQPAGPRGGPMGMMMRADANRDGTITREEYQAEVDARFARRDANGNGRIDEGEGPRGRRLRGDAPPPPPPPAPSGAAPVAATPPPPPPPSEVGMTRDQFRERAMRRFDRLDANRDGRIDAAEMRAAMPRRGDRPAPPPAD